MRMTTAIEKCCEISRGNWNDLAVGSEYTNRTDPNKEQHYKNRKEKKQRMRLFFLLQRQQQTIHNIKRRILWEN